MPDDNAADPAALADKALAWLGGGSAADIDNAPTIAAAVVAFVDDLPGVDAGAWDDREMLGAVILTARLIRRRNSPAGVEIFGDQGAVYVRRNDPDVAQMLRLDRWARPKIG